MNFFIHSIIFTGRLYSFVLEAWGWAGTGCGIRNCFFDL